MKVYRLDDDETTSWHGTLADVRTEGKRIPPVYRGAVRIHEVHIRTDKQGVLCLLKTKQPAIERVGREWRLTSRGGLRAIQVAASERAAGSRP